MRGVTLQMRFEHVGIATGEFASGIAHTPS
jgi:hypothetical protein